LLGKQTVHLKDHSEHTVFSDC